MEPYIHRKRNSEVLVVSAKGETGTESFQEWAGGEQVAWQGPIPLGP